MSRPAFSSAIIKPCNEVLGSDVFIRVCDDDRRIGRKVASASGHEISLRESDLQRTAEAVVKDEQSGIPASPFSVLVPVVILKFRERDRSPSGCRVGLGRLVAAQHRPWE